MSEDSRNIDPYVISDSLTIKDAIQTIQQNASRCCIVTNEDEKVVGIFSEGDVLRALLTETSIYTTLKSVLKPSFLYLHAYDKKEALRIFKKYGISLIPVVDEDFKLVNVVTLLGLLSELQLPTD
jgi:CBS domain-containing protein